MLTRAGMTVARVGDREAWEVKWDLLVVTQGVLEVSVEIWFFDSQVQHFIFLRGEIQHNFENA